MSLVEIFLLLFLLLSLPSFYSLLNILERGVQALEKMAASSEKASVVAEAMGGVLKAMPPFPPISSPSPLKDTSRFSASFVVERLPFIPPGLEIVIFDHIKEFQGQLGESIEVTNAVLLDVLEKLEDSAPEHVLRFLKEAPQVDRSIASLWLKSWGGGYVLAWLPTKQESPDDVPSC